LIEGGRGKKERPASITCKGKRGGRKRRTIRPQRQEVLRKNVFSFQTMERGKGKGLRRGEGGEERREKKIRGGTARSSQPALEDRGNDRGEGGETLYNFEKEKGGIPS